MDWLTAIAFAWIFQSVIAGAVAENTGKNSLTWYLLALVTVAPLALLAVCAMSEKNTKKVETTGHALDDHGVMA